MFVVLLLRLIGFARRRGRSRVIFHGRASLLPLRRRRRLRPRSGFISRRWGSLIPRLRRTIHLGPRLIIRFGAIRLRSRRPVVGCGWFERAIVRPVIRSRLIWLRLVRLRVISRIWLILPRPIRLLVRLRPVVRRGLIRFGSIVRLRRGRTIIPRGRLEWTIRPRLTTIVGLIRLRTIVRWLRIARLWSIRSRIIHAGPLVRGRWIPAWWISSTTTSRWKWRRSRWRSSDDSRSR